MSASSSLSGILGLATLSALAPVGALAQSASNLAALHGLAPVSVLLNTPEGKAALAANLKVTGAIQTGILEQPILLPFPEQQRQSLRDAFITDRNAAELADGLGTKLGPIYQAIAHYDDPTHATQLSTPVADFIAYTNRTTASDSNAGKYFFANATTDGKTPVSEAATAILAATHGVTDVFGKAYDRPAGSAGADAFGNSRPFQTEPSLTRITGADYFGKPADGMTWLYGPSQHLVDSPAYPSGHTTFGYMESVLLALLVPERYQQMIVRAAEYGNDRIILGAHYAMDVIGGRTLALYDVAHLLANDPAYVGRSFEGVATIPDYPAALKAARADMTAALRAGCWDARLATCAATDTGRFSQAAANAAFYDVTQTYGLPVVYRHTAEAREDVAKVAPEAGHLLTAAFPSLTLAEANDILTATQGPGGGFLNDGSAFGLYSRLNLYAAAGQAAALASTR